MCGPSRSCSPCGSRDGGDSCMHARPRGKFRLHCDPVSAFSWGACSNDDGKIESIVHLKLSKGLIVCSPIFLTLGRMNCPRTLGMAPRSWDRD